MGIRTRTVPVEGLSGCRETLRKAALVFEHTDTYRGSGELRPLVRHRIEAWGGRVAGSPSGAAHVADDKIEAARRLKAAGLRVPRSWFLSDRTMTRIPRIRYPVMMKRPFEHGSRGVVLVENLTHMMKTMKAWARRGEQTVLFEELIGGQELAVGVVETARGLRVLPPIAVTLNGRTYSARAKWGPSPLPIEAADVDSRLQRRLSRDAGRAFRALGLRGYARFDLRLDSRGAPCFLEANARPSIEDGTEMRLACELAGMSFEVFLLHVIENAARRHGDSALARLAAEMRQERER